MPWVCKICSTNNEDSADICFVCDSARSEATYSPPASAEKTCTLTWKRVQNLKLSGNVVIPNDYNVIGEWAFLNRKDIYTVEIHAGVTKIEKEAFCGCSNLRTVKYNGELLQRIGKRAFADCTSYHKSLHLGAKYVAPNAYEITPIPEPIPTIAPTTATTYPSTPAPSAYVPKYTAPTPPKPVDDNPKIVTGVVWISILISLAAAILFNIINWDGVISIFWMIDGAATLSLLLLSIVKMCISKPFRLFSIRSCYPIFILLMLINYVCCITMNGTKLGLIITFIAIGAISLVLAFSKTQKSDGKVDDIWVELALLFYSALTVTSFFI